MFGSVPGCALVIDSITRTQRHTHSGGGLCDGGACGPELCHSGHLGSELVCPHGSGASAETRREPEGPRVVNEHCT
jgi:hypothetical protein